MPKDPPKLRQYAGEAAGRERKEARGIAELTIELSPHIMELLNENEQRLLLLRYPSLIAEESLPAFAALNADSDKRRRALLRFFKYIRTRARREERMLLEKLSSLNVLYARLQGRVDESSEMRCKLILERRAKLLAKLYSTLGKIPFRTVTHITGLPFGSVTCVVHRARAKIEYGLSKEENSGLVPRVRTRAKRGQKSMLVAHRPQLEEIYDPQKSQAISLSISART
jgi:hypothetical protein